MPKAQRKPDVVLCTAIRYGGSNADILRTSLVTRTVEEADARNLPIIVVDGGSAMNLGKRLAKLGARVEEQVQPGMGSSRRQAMRAAEELVAKDGAIVWIEPEKHTLVPQIEYLVRTILDGDADLVSLERISLESYPPEQAAAEKFGNSMAATAVGNSFDLWMGTTGIGRRALPYYLDYQGEYGDLWDAITIPKIRVIADDHLQVVKEHISYHHPQDQTRDEYGQLSVGLKRLQQLDNLLPAICRECYILGLTAQETTYNRVTA